MGPETAGHWRLMALSYLLFIFYDSSVLSQLCSSWIFTSDSRSDFISNEPHD